MYGSKEFLVAIGQQLSWMTASFRLPQHGQVSYSDAVLHGKGVGVFHIDPIPLQSVGVRNDVCWLPLFYGSVIARDYPIPRRQWEKGLELPFHLMTTLTGPLQPILYDGGIILQGYSRLLFPMSLSESGTLQWHLVTSNSRREALPEGTIHQYHWLKIRNPQQLTAVRTFLGYCRHAVVELGTEMPVDCHKKIHFSGADYESHGPSLQGPSSITWGSSGMGIFGGTITHPIIWGKSLADNIVGQNHSYLDVLNLAMKTPMILYDDDEGSQRAWMVPALSIVLHMVHTWAVQHDALEQQLPYAALTFDSGEAAKSVLIQKWDFVLRDTPNEEMSKRKIIKDLVIEYWEDLTRMKWKNIETTCESTPRLDLSSSQLYGWEYMDIVLGEQLMRRRQLSLNGNWQILTEDVLVLFGRGFGDVIKPAAGVIVCKRWNPIPPKENYLTATIGCLQLLSWRFGGCLDSLTSPRLTNTAYWNFCTTHLFTDCQDCCSSSLTKAEKCLKRPQYLRRTPGERLDHQIPPAEGAVVFSYDPDSPSRPLRNSATRTSERIKRYIVQRLAAPE